MPLPLLLAAEAGGGAPPFLAPVTLLLVGAAVAAYGAMRLRQVPIIGFLAVGVLIGPYALGLVERAETIEAAAEIGVVLLLFTIGVEFSLDRLKRIRRLVALGGALQVGLVTALTTGVLVAAGVGVRPAVYTGLLVSLSSTAIVLKLLASRGETASPGGRVAVGLLIFQDLAVVAMVLAVPILGGDGGGFGDLTVALLRAAAIVALVLVGARRLVPPLLEAVARTCSQEVFLLVVVALCFGAAYLTSLAGVSLSLGAFLAGLLVSESRFDLQALGEVLPLQVLFSAVFFISIGMLLDLGFVVRNLPIVLAVVAAILVGKVLTTAVAARVAGQPWALAGSAALLLGQVGEFSFVLETVGRDAGLAPAGAPDGSQVFIAATVLLMALTPALATAGRRFEARMTARGGTATGALDAGPDGDVRGHVLIAGYGPVAQRLADLLDRIGIPQVISTLSPTGATAAREAGRSVLQGDAGRDLVLREAGIEAAHVLVVADDDAEATRRIATVAHSLRPDLPVLAHVDGGDHDEVADDVSVLVTDERASGLALGLHVLRHFGLSADAVAPYLADAAAGWSPSVVVEQMSRIDTDRTIDFEPGPTDCAHLDTIRPVAPSAPGCEDCLRVGGTWVHLRLCLSCGHVGCCDSSPSRHATAHHHQTRHALIRSAEPGEDWAWCYVDEVVVEPAR